MFVRIHAGAVEQGTSKLLLTSAHQQDFMLSPLESPVPLMFRSKSARIGISSSGGDNGSRGETDVRHDRYRPPVNDGGNFTAKALLIGGCVLAVGVVVLAAARFSQVSSVDAGTSAAPGEMAGTSIEIDDEPEEIIEIPEITTPDNPDAPPAQTRKRMNSVTTADVASTDVVSPGTGEDDQSATNHATLPSITVPKVFRIDGPIAVPKYNRPNPYAEVQTVDLIDDTRVHRVMASLSEISVHTVPLKSDVRGDVSLAVSSGVRGALERCQLRYRGGISEPIMLVQLNIVENGDVQSLTMTATLLVNRESRMLKVWQKTGEIGAITDQALQKGILPPNLTRDVSSFFTELRSQFVDVRRKFK
jgi:hypothetical protein